MPWGDPDLQGNYTNKYEQGTPFERPDEFAGRQIEDLKHDELKDILQERQDRALLSITLAGGDPAGNLGGPLWWQDQFEVSKGSRPWLVIDPTDGKIPPLTQQAQQRITARAAAARANRNGGADSYTDRSLYDRCITRGLPGSMMPVIYGNSYDIVQGPGLHRNPIRDGARDARDPARRPFSRRQRPSQPHGRCARPLGRQHIGGRDDALP
jgi:hypothetical protein